MKYNFISYIIYKKKIGQESLIGEEYLNKMSLWFAFLKVKTILLLSLETGVENITKDIIKYYSVDNFSLLFNKMLIFSIKPFYSHR